MPDGPEDPFNELATGATATHAMYVAYREAGFSRAEALQLVIGIITAGVRHKGDD